MNTTTQNDGRISMAETTARLRKVRFGCTPVANRDRLRRFIDANERPVTEKRLMAILPGLIAAEADAVRAAADEAGDKLLHERAKALRAWSDEVRGDENLQVLAVTLLTPRVDDAE
jgi:hypothetical protein